MGGLNPALQLWGGGGEHAHNIRLVNLKGDIDFLAGQKNAEKFKVNF